MGAEIVDLGLGKGVGKNATISTFGLDNAGEDLLSTKLFSNTAGGGLILGETMIGTASLFNAGTNAYGAYWAVRQGNQAIDLQKQQLELAKTQYADEKARYEKRQGEIDEFNKASGEAGAKFSENIAKQYANLPVNRI